MTTHAWSLEWLFTGVALAVVVEAIMALRVALSTRMDLGSLDGPRREVANLNVEMGQFFLAIALLTFGVSLASLFLRPPPPDYKAVPQTVVLVVGWIVMGLLFVGASLRSTAARNRLMKFAATFEQDHP